jgi:L-ascorbate metabolism protein UlaG (beta-lactamase superfamily)
MQSLKPAQKQDRTFQNPVPTTIGGLRMALKVLPLYLSNREERTPAVSPGPFVTETTRYAQPPASGLRVTWFGHSSLLVEIDGFRLLLDPMWDRRASPFRWMGPERFFPPTLVLEKLPALDAVLVSHDHYDHLGKETIRGLAQAAPARDAQWITSLGVGSILREFGLSKAAVELDWTQATTLRKPVAGGEAEEQLVVTALPARHFSGRGLNNRFHTLWSSFVLRGPRHTVYFGADSGWWDGFAQIGEQYGPFDVSMLEIGAYNELWHEIHLGPDGAARAFAALGETGLLMPIHWGLFDLALHGWRAPMTRMVELAEVQGLRLWSPTPGVPTEVVADQALISDWWRE